MRILHVLGWMRRAGGEMRTVELCRSLAGGPFEFEFCSITGQTGELDDAVRELGSVVHYCPRDLLLPARLGRLLRIGRYDIVHAQVWYFSGLVLRIAAYCGVPGRIVHFRNTREARAPTPARRAYTGLMRRWIDRYATKIIAVSEQSMDLAWRAGWRDDPRCEVVYDGIDTAPFEAPEDREGVRAEFGWDSNTAICIHVARMHPQKNHLRVVEVYAEALRLMPDLRLLLVGEGGNEIETQVRARIAKLGLGDRVCIAGVRADVPRLMKASDILLFPSFWEGCPGVMLEALAAGLPVLGSNVAGTNEVARYFPQARLLELAAPDAEWAAALAELVREGRGTGPDWRTWASTPFGLEVCAGKLKSIWSASERLPERQRA